MGANHARIIAGSGVAQLHVVVDLDPGAAERVAGRFDARAATSPEALAECDAVVVASPTEHHLASAMPLLAAGCPVLVEKPLANDPASVHALVGAARDAGVVLMCGFVERFNAAVVTGLQRLTAPPVSFHTVRHSPAAPRITTSVVSDLLIHDLDLVASALPGRRAVSVAAVLATPAGTSVVEQADAVVGWEGGPVANLSASRMGQRKVRTLSVTSGNELVEVDLLRQNVTVYRHVTHELVDGSYRSDTIVDIPFVRHAGEPLALQFEHFVALVRGDADREVELASLVVPHEIAFRVDGEGAHVEVAGAAREGGGS
jgi:predicted dehydrogenase